MAATAGWRQEQPPSLPGTRWARSRPPPQANIREGSTALDLDDGKLAKAGGLDVLAAALRRADVRASLTILYLR